jgi:uncharacterized membrane protein
MTPWFRLFFLYLSGFEGGLSGWMNYFALMGGVLHPRVPIKQEIG